MSQASLPDVGEWGNASVIAQKAVQKNVAAHARYLARQSRNRYSFISALMKLLPGLLVLWLPSFVLQHVIWKWPTISYLFLYRALLRCHDPSRHECSEIFSEPRIDDWILVNERWLRDSQHDDWRTGMLTLEDAPVIFPNSILTSEARLVFRFDALPGFEILCEDRESHICIQPSTTAFKRNFEVLSDHLLDNLDWNNVFAAGGMVLGALMVVRPSAFHSHHPGHWASSDIDLYLHGLSADAANKKILHIFDVFRSNLPTGMRTLVIRNSHTITFYAEYPIRRVQIVLKLVSNPKDVLLNFDLDVCSLGWDGANVWMLPRAARALERCNTFTMNLLHGHYLSERRATQPQRIFKYADRGYGIRFLPSYISSLSTQGPANANDVLTQLGDEARSWVDDRIGPDGYWPSVVVALNFRHMKVLSSFLSLMRHVHTRHLIDRRFQVIVPEQNTSASASYDDTYEPIPRLQYQWNEAFTHSRFRTYIMLSNVHDIDEWIRTDLRRRLPRHGIENGDDLDRAQRMTFASNAEEILDRTHDIRMPVLLPVDFAIYANSLVNKALVSRGLSAIPVLERVPAGSLHDSQDTPDREGLFMWNIGPQLMWQRTDRRIDEVFEVLYAFRRANQPLRPETQLQRFKAEVSRRSRTSPTAVRREFEVFAEWVYQPL